MNGHAEEEAKSSQLYRTRRIRTTDSGGAGEDKNPEYLSAKCNGGDCESFHTTSGRQHGRGLVAPIAKCSSQKQGCRLQKTKQIDNKPMEVCSWKVWHDHFHADQKKISYLPHKGPALSSLEGSELYILLTCSRSILQPPASVVGLPTAFHSFNFSRRVLADAGTPNCNELMNPTKRRIGGYECAVWLRVWTVDLSAQMSNDRRRHFGVDRGLNTRKISKPELNLRIGP
ncbi:hypothetical protein GUJ93_ZPchr0006g42107 [Zizania palustris]|uniref:Uncharacterized protein n=1 Tax=Zizania palustris TaxID=103762 RepID=A0A8J5VKS0_ZIZPA|nr:hypothetical protein GUJ93_ZPchr0006g42107 [Zizania palustris]